MNSFYSEEELGKIGFKEIGKNVLISRHASIYSPSKISIGNNVRIDDFCILSGNITLGNYIHISAYSALFGGKSGIVMKDFSGVSSKNVIYADSDDYSGEYLTNPMIPDKYRNVYSGKVILDKHVLVGSGCVILPNVHINEGASIGAMSLITKDIPEWSICVGIPCKKIKDRLKNILQLEKQFLIDISDKC